MIMWLTRLCRWGQSKAASHKLVKTTKSKRARLILVEHTATGAHYKSVHFIAASLPLSHQV